MQSLSGYYDVLLGFEKIAILGKGNYGVVYLVKNKSDKKFYAMKVLNKADLKKRKQLRHIDNELKVLELARPCPFVTTMASSFVNSEYIYICLEFCQGGEIFRLIRDLGRMNELTTAFYCAEVLAALQFLHSHNIAYRDLKPENVLICKDGHIKLCDFGFAKFIVGRSWTLCGTPEYLAPELILGTGHDKAVDWWAFGVFIYELLAGYPPFHGSTDIETYDQILDGCYTYPLFFSATARDLITKLLEPSMSRRLGNLVGGIEEIKQHPFFSSINWVLLEDKQIEPPAIPNLDDEEDLRHFELLEHTDYDCALTLPYTS